VHETAHNKAGCRTTGEMKSRSLFDSQMAVEATLGEEVCGELDRAAETCADHSRSYTSIYTLHTFAAVNLAETIDRVFIVVLCTDGKERRIRLKTGLHKEERRASCGTDHTRCSASEDISPKRLDLRVIVKDGGDVRTNWLVESETAAIE